MDRDQGRRRWIEALARAASLALAIGCGGGDRAAPAPPDLVLAKPENGSGDQQGATAGTQLTTPLRVIVTQDSQPVAGAVVRWSTTEGTLEPVVDTTGIDGASEARWTLQFLYAQQVAAATLGDGSGAVRFTAIATPDPSAQTTVLVGAGEANEFAPSELSIAVGDTVNWVWPEGSAGHNVVPDDGDAPPQSGPPVGYPNYHSYRFAAPGVYHYHCQVHGAAGGVGMAGTITVRSGGPR